MSEKIEGLLNKPNTDTINAYNLDGQVVSRPASNFRFRLSVYGILLDEDKILFHINPDTEALCLPGGGVEIDETMEDALKREFLEETGIHVDVGQQIIAVEDFFTFQEDDVHSVLVLYRVKRKLDRIQEEIKTKVESEGLEYVHLYDIKSAHIQRVFRKMFDLIEVENLKMIEKS